MPDHDPADAHTDAPPRPPTHIRIDLKPARTLPADNALQLHLGPTDDDDEDDGDLPAPGTSPPDAANAPPTPLARVRFRSRVRITSGLRHSQRSLDSSDSDSPSSSISAPLRYRPADAAPRGPLGQRISALAAQALQKRRAAAAVFGMGDERVPFAHAGQPDVYGATRNGDSGGGGGGDGSSDGDGGSGGGGARVDEGVAFGRWPWRAFNRHWWWWQIESTLCCCCSDESDADE